MKESLSIIIEACEYSVYYGLDDTLHSLIMIQDEIDDRFKKNEYIDLIACTLLYHQMVEKFIQSLIKQFEFNIKLFKKCNKKYRQGDTFSNRLKCLKRVIQDGYAFEL